MPIRLTWLDNNPHEDANEVYRSETTMDLENMPAPLAVLAANTTHYDDTTALDGDTYFYRVAAVRGSARAISDELQVTVGLLRPVIRDVIGIEVPVDP